MKHLTLLFSILILTISCFAQYDFWPTPEIITTEGEDCYNASIQTIRLSSANNEMHYLFYNKKINDSTTGIFARAIYDPDIEYQIYCESGVISSFNGIMNTNYTTTNPIIFFERQNFNDEQRDIYFVQMINGVLSEPVPYFTSDQDEHRLRCTLDPRRIVWQCGDTIKTRYFEYNHHPNDTLNAYETVVIEGGNCHDPIISYSGETIRYIKDFEDYQAVQKVNIVENNPVFEIITEFEGEEIKNLIRPGGSVIGGEAASWERDNGNHKIFVSDWLYGNKIDSINWTQENPFYSSLFQVNTITVEDIFSSMVAVNLDNDTTQGIYISSNTGYYHISQSENYVQYPLLSLGKEEYWYYDIILLYEEIWNENRHIMASNMKLLWGGTNENQRTNNSITISPNPITSNFSVTINNPESNAVQFTLYSLNGMKSNTLSRNVNAGVVNKIPFSVEDFGGNIVPGPYVLECRDGENINIIKIMII